MYLKVTCKEARSNETLFNEQVRGFDDYRKVGSAVAKAVTDWVRNVPVGKQVRAAVFNVTAEWVDTTAKGKEANE